VTELPATTGADRFDALAVAFADEPGVSVGQGRRGFGSGTLMVDGRIFALVNDGRLVLKLPAPRVAALIAEGVGVPFTAGKATPLREWVGLPDATPGWLELASESVAFVAARRPG
jgi:TfoX-like protein